MNPQTCDSWFMGSCCKVVPTAAPSMSFKFDAVSTIRHSTAARHQHPSNHASEGNSTLRRAYKFAEIEPCYLDIYTSSLFIKIVLTPSLLSLHIDLDKKLE